MSFMLTGKGCTIPSLLCYRLRNGMMFTIATVSNNPSARWRGWIIFFFFFVDRSKPRQQGASWSPHRVLMYHFSQDPTSVDRCHKAMFPIAPATCPTVPQLKSLDLVCLHGPIFPSQTIRNLEHFHQDIRKWATWPLPGPRHSSCKYITDILWRDGGWVVGIVHVVRLTQALLNRPDRPHTVVLTPATDPSSKPQIHGARRAPRP